MGAIITGKLSTGWIDTDELFRGTLLRAELPLFTAGDRALGGGDRERRRGERERARDERPSWFGDGERERCRAAVAISGAAGALPDRDELPTLVHWAIRANNVALTVARSVLGVAALSEKETGLHRVSVLTAATAAVE